MRKLLGALALLVVSVQVRAGIPATPVMTLYAFNGPVEVPYYSAERFRPGDPGAPIGTLAQGTSLIPCLVIRDGAPLTDASGTPYVGFEVVVDPRRAGPEARARFLAAVERRKGLEVENHHCEAGVRGVIDVRQLYAMEKAPFFTPPPAGRPGATPPAASSQLDRIVRDFHASSECARANARLSGRRGALERAWEDYLARRRSELPLTTLARAKHLDYTLRTALFEGHHARGCNAYGACERNIVALTIRNRAVGQCPRHIGCTFPGDFQGVASKVSQYNIWDEFLTQISGLTACYLRPDLADEPRFAKLQAMYAQSVGDVERILYGDDDDLRAVFPGTDLAKLKRVRHYYHAPAMGKCFPEHPRVEYMSGAVARSGDDFALIANTRIEVGETVGTGYRFKQFRFDELEARDRTWIEDRYPGFVVDGRKVSLRAPSDCRPYGIPAGCRLDDSIGRYRKIPHWADAGEPLEIRCRVIDRGSDCDRDGDGVIARVGGACDREMRPVSGVR
ncbi:hypothetical protein L0E83_02805 [Marichromatium gracile]|uniref:hypothetical protein n=1 Tax=Marichromatium gracile TaxID=1048 RepID=UPI001F39BC61|nr:hypothetical protein [Marichromatium gracile]MCF1182364.1 hypothetical protein [Marichromatium gracile]